MRFYFTICAVQIGRLNHKNMTLPIKAPNPQLRCTQLQGTLQSLAKDIAFYKQQAEKYPVGSSQWQQWNQALQIASNEWKGVHQEYLDAGCGVLPPHQTSRFEVAGVEITQAVQYFRSQNGPDNGIPLVAWKPTAIRVYVDRLAVAPIESGKVTGSITYGTTVNGIFQVLGTLTRSTVLSTVCRPTVLTGANLTTR